MTASNQLTFFDLERAAILKVAANAAGAFAKTHYSPHMSAADMQSEAAIIALNYYVSPNYNVRFLYRKIVFELSHRLEAVDKDIERARRKKARARLVATDSNISVETAASTEGLSLDVAIEIGAELANYSPPVAAAISDIINGYSFKDAAARNKLKTIALKTALNKFREKMKNVI